MLKMMDYLPVNFLHGGCLCHILQLVINVELLGKLSIKSLVKICRHICTFGNQSVQLSQFVVTKQMKAIQDVVTRWNSTFMMLKRFVELQPVIRAILLDHDWQKKLDVRLTSADWTLMEKVVKVLEVFYEATLMLSSSSACYGTARQTKWPL